MKTKIYIAFLMGSSKNHIRHCERSEAIFCNTLQCTDCFGSTFLAKTFFCIFRTALFAFLALNLKAQDVHFSQYMSAPAIINPALTGDFLGSQRGGIAYKDQWRSVTEPFKTMHAFFDAALNESSRGDYFGVGVDIYSDKAGYSRMGTDKLSVSGSYAKALSRFSTYAFGVQLGLIQKSIDYSELTWGTQFNGFDYDPDLPSQEYEYNTNFIKPDLSAGASWYYLLSDLNTMRMGVAMYHINSPRLDFFTESYERIAPRYVFHTEVRLEDRNSNVAYLPRILYQRQNTLSEFVFGGLIEYQLKEGSRVTGWIKETTLSFGLLHRWQDAIVFITQFSVNHFELGLSYDINVSSLSAVSKNQGGMEISLIYTTPYISRWRKGSTKSRF